MVQDIHENGQVGERIEWTQYFSKFVYQLKNVRSFLVQPFCAAFITQIASIFCKQRGKNLLKIFTSQWGENQLANHRR